MPATWGKLHFKENLCYSAPEDNLALAGERFSGLTLIKTSKNQFLTLVARAVA
jgi:hypothetical protein